MKQVFIVLTVVLFTLLIIESNVTMNCAPIFAYFTMCITFFTMLMTLYCYINIAIDDVEE